MSSNAERAAILTRALRARIDRDRSAISEIYTDGDKLQRIVSNILWNAAKFTKKGTVRVSAALVQSSDESAAVALPKRLQPWERLLSLSIQDTGIGIAEKDVAKIFQDFRQAHAGSTRPYGGLGIGLTIARRLTEILGGVIRVRSRLEEGSVFQVFVPVQASVAS